VRGGRDSEGPRGAVFSLKRAVSVWNELPEAVVEAGYNFKTHLDSYMGKMGVEGYGPSAGNWDITRMLPGLDGLRIDWDFFPWSVEGLGGDRSIK